VAQEGVVLTEAQLAALERKREYQEAHAEFECEHPGYCGAQDVYYAGNLKGGAEYPASARRSLALSPTRPAGRKVLQQQTPPLLSASP
jgi:hypothetical protein